MRNIWTIAKREYKLFFISPIAYVIAFIIFLIIGYIFYTNVAYASIQQYNSYYGSYVPDITIVLSPLITIFLFTTPAITMRTLADEQRTGTLELMLTSPVRDWELVIGKWLGAFLFFLTIIALTGIYPLLLNRLVSPGIDQGLLISGYLGLILLGSVFVAIGVMTSSFFSNQIAAFFASLGILLLMWMLSYPVQALGGSGGILTYLDLSQHILNTFMAGIIELKDIVYYLSVTSLALLIGSTAIEMRRWR